MPRFRTKRRKLVRDAKGRIMATKKPVVGPESHDLPQASAAAAAAASGGGFPRGIESEVGAAAISESGNDGDLCDGGAGGSSRSSSSARGGSQVSLASHTSQFQQRPTAETMAEECSVLVKSLQECKEEVLALCAEKHCNPILVRLAWHDAGTFNKASSEPWPRCGGANGSIRFEPEINHGANAGLSIALKLLQPIKDKHPEVGWADLIQLASAAAIEQCGGPVIDMKYGRKDATTPQCCVDEGNLPAGNAPFPDADTPQAHIRNVFYRMGFDDEGIVALSGAHTIGRAKKDRSGEGAECTRITSEGMCPRGAGVSGVGTPGGSAWTKNWLKFDNSYFSEMPDEGSDPEILKLATDKCLFTDDGFKPFARKYKDSQDAFFADYKKAHKKLSELGVVWEPEGGFTI